MKSTKTVKEAYAFLGLTLAFSYFVFWGPLALFKIPTISFVSDVKGPTWAIALFLVGGFVPSLLAIFLTWKKEGLSGLRYIRSAYHSIQAWLALVRVYLPDRYCWNGRATNH